MAGYPRVIGGHYPGLGVYGYVAGQEVPTPGMPQHPALMAPPMQMHPGMMPVYGAPHPAVHSPPWRPMVAPGSPPLGEGHVPLPLNAETFNGVWGGAGGAPAGTIIIFSARPQKPFKLSRLVVSKTPSGATAIGRILGQAFVGTDLQQGELGFVDIETIGAGTAFDTWVSFKQAEPGVWVRIQATLTAFPSGEDFVIATLSAMGHYLH